MMEEVKSGMVSIQDASGRSQPIKLQLMCDTLLLLKEELVFTEETENEEIFNKVREVEVTREEEGGLGLSVKGGAEHQLPPLVSKVIVNQAAAKTGQIFVGDAILKINGYPCYGLSHNNIMQKLRLAGDKVVLTLKYFKPAAIFLSKDSMSNSTTPESESGSVSPRIERQWNVFVSLPLMFAYLTRYVCGTDKLRTNAFEVVGVNGLSTGVVNCEDSHSLADWIRAITNNISTLLSYMVKMSNRLLIPEDQIIFMNWTQERVSPTRHFQAWKPKFFSLKGNDVYLFDVPPMQTRDWVRCDTVFKVYECMFKVLKDIELSDDRQHCCTIMTGTGEKIYLSTDSRSDLLQLEKAWYRANHISINRIKSRTFGCTWRGQLSGLTLDLTCGFSLYDQASKSFMWSYKFSQLKGSSDDGRTKLKLHFSSADNPSQLEVREVECTSLQTLLFCIHAFLSAKLASVDPTFLRNY